MKACVFCDELFEIDFLRRIRGDNSKYCDNSCSTLAQVNSKLTRGKVAAYKNPDLWAIDFKLARGRKPNRSDWAMAFDGTTVPNFANMRLFSRAPSSLLEEKVNHYLGTIFPKLELKRRHRRRLAGGLLELDFYFPELDFGIEVQDFRTHSRASNETPSPLGGFKKGPRYHEHKREAYSSIGIRVFELWEDSIMADDYEELAAVLRGLTGRKNV